MVVVEAAGTNRPKRRAKAKTGAAADDGVARASKKSPARRTSAWRDHGVKILSSSVLNGCNAYAHTAVIVMDVDLGALADQDGNRVGADFIDRYVERFNGLDPLNPGNGLERTFVEHLRSGDGVSFFDLVFRAMLAVDTAAARAMRRLRDIEYCQVIREPESRRARFVWSSRFHELSRRAAEAGLAGVTELLPDELTWPSAAAGPGFDQALASLLKAARRERTLPPAAVLLDAAERKGIPWARIGGNVIRLGQGKFQGRIWSTVTSNTSRVGDRLSQDKVATHRVLEDIGLPVPRQIGVGSVREAKAAAEAIGYPVVVKPLGGNTGKGVSANLKAAREITPAFKRAREVGSDVVVESFVTGDDYRLLVVGGRVAAAARRVPPSVTGDGRRTIAELIEELNADPLRDNFRRARIKLDQELNRLLELAGYKLGTVLADGEAFRLRSTANVSTGGFTMDVTDILHPDNAEMAIRAAEAVGLDVAGVDFLTTDIARSYREVGGGIVEVNSRPGLRPHIWPVSGQSRDVGSAVIETMFPPGEQGRVPVAIVAGPDARGLAVAERAAALLRGAGIELALLPGDEAPAIGGDAETADSAARQAEVIRRRLSDPRLAAMIRIVALDDVARHGLLTDACATAVIMNAGESDAERLGQEIVRRATVGAAIHPADLDLPTDLAGRIGTEGLMLVATGGENALLQRHLSAGGRAVVAENGSAETTISLVGASAAAAVVVAALPAGTRRDAVDVEAFAVALALNMGFSPPDMRPDA